MASKPFYPSPNYLRTFIDPNKPVDEYEQSDWYDVADEFESFAECNDVVAFQKYFEKYSTHPKFDWSFALNQIIKNKCKRLFEIIVQSDSVKEFVFSDRGKTVRTLFPRHY